MGTIEIEGRTKDGVKGSVRLDPYGNLAVTSGGSLREAALDGRLFSVMNQGKIATNGMDGFRNRESYRQRQAGDYARVLQCTYYCG